MTLPVEVKPIFLENRYAIQRSLRFRLSAGANLTRTPATAGNRQTWTWSAWVKRGTLGVVQYLFSASEVTNNVIRFNADDSMTFYVYFATGATSYGLQNTTQLFRDPSSWYHIVAVLDSGNATNTDRLRLYINNVRVTSAGTNNVSSITQSTNGDFNQAQAHYISRYYSAGAQYLDGYLAEVNFIDGQALAPTAFGQFDGVTGVWTPAKYGGSYGTNGFYLPYTNTASAETLAYDLSNSNPELISNGMFVSNVTGWTAAGSGSPSITWQSNHTMRIANSANNAPWAYTTISTVIGQTYYAQAYIFAASIGGTSRSIVLKKADDANYSVNSVDLASTTQAGVPTGLQGTFTATATTTYIIIFADVIGTGTTGIDVSQISAALGAYKKNWNPFNISTTAGTTYDAMTDVPPPPYIQNVAAGNYCVLNPLSNPNGPIFTLSNGNLTYSCSASAGNAPKMAVVGSFGMSSGKWYCEATETSTNSCFGINGGLVSGGNANGVNYAFVYNGGAVASAATYSGTTPTYTTNDIIGLALDVGALTLAAYKNGTLLGTFSGLEASIINWFFLQTVASGASATSSVWNFGQRPFSYTPPSGFLPLNTNNLPSPTIPNGAKYMAAVTYPGTGSSQTITATTTNSGNNPLATTFQPDLVWGKCRNTATTSNWLENSIIGAGTVLYSDQTISEQNATAYLTGFTPSGFSVAGNTSYFNSSTGTYVAWQWNAGSGSSTVPSGGTITPTAASVNVSAGFSIIAYTGTGSNATVPHGLGATPAFIMIKDRTSASNGGVVYHTSLGATQYLQLFITTNGNVNATTDNTMFNGASPTFNSSVFSVGTNVRTNTTDNYIAYIWTPVSGYSAFGSYAGVSSTDGPFVYCGFRPRFIMYKNTTTTSTGWVILDTTRDPYNVEGQYLQPNTSGAEGTTAILDVLSNGFKFRYSSTDTNLAGNTYIYAAFAENPMKFSLAR